MDSTTIQIPSVRSFQFLLLIVPSAIGYLILFPAVKTLLNGYFFAIIPVLISTVMGSIPLIVFLWCLFGYEKIEANEDYFKLEKTIFGIGSKRKIKTSVINHIVYDFSPSFNIWGEAEIEDVGYLILYTEFGIIKFSEDINRKEAMEILDSLKSLKYLNREIFSPYPFLNNIQKS